MFDPEYYMSEYEIRDLSKGTVRVGSGRYRDFADTGPREEIVYDEKVKNDERHTFYCVNIPGESSWAQEAWKTMYPDEISNTIPSTSNPSRKEKRCLEDMQEGDNGNEEHTMTKVLPNNCLADASSG